MSARRKYVPHFAEFFFEPVHDWSIEDARRLYEADAGCPVDWICYDDCIAGMREMREHAAGSVQLCIADPPFGIDFHGREHIYNRDPGNVIGGYSEVSSDDYLDFTRAWLSVASPLLASTGSMYLFSGWSNLRQVLVAVDEVTDLHLVNHIIWRKNFNPFTSRKFASAHYHVLFLVRDPKRYFFNKVEHYIEDVWEINVENRPGIKKNGNKLPMDVVERCIDFSSRPGDIVLDPFMGNGTTAECARATFRHYIGFEMNLAMRAIHEHNTSNVGIGEHYRPYNERKPTVEKLAELYPVAYKEYLKVIRGMTRGGT